MRRPLVALLVLLSLASAAILARSSLNILPSQWALVLILSVLIGVSHHATLIDLGGKLSLFVGGVMAAFLIGGPELTLWAIAIGTSGEQVVYWPSLASVVFNITAYTLTSWFSFWVFAQLGGAWGHQFDHPMQAVVMAIVFMAVNAGLAAAFLHARGQTTMKAALRGMLSGSSIRAYLTIAVLGVFVGFAYLKGGLLWAGATLALAYNLERTLVRYFEAVEDARRQAQQLEVVLNATRGALIMTDDEGVIQVANRQIGTLFSVDPERLIGRPEWSVSELREVRGQMDQQGEQGDQVIELLRGPARFVHWYRAAVHNPQGEPQGHVEVFTDVTALKEAEEDLRRLYDSTIRALTAAIDARDSYTHGHSARVSAYAVAVAQQMGLPEKELERIRYSGLLHDIGKLGVDDTVLRKTGILTPDERALMMQHPVIGAEVLEKADMLSDLIPGVRWHHEWVSGGGYPDGLKGEEIPLDARIIGVADALDAMTSDRPYRPALPLEEALRRIQSGAGVQFDTRVAVALMTAIDSGALLLGKVDELGARATEMKAEGTIRPIHGKELSIFYQLSREDYAVMGLDATLRRYLEIFYDTIGPNVYLVYLVDPETGALECKCRVGLRKPDEGRPKDLRLVREALAKGDLVVLHDVRQLEDYVPAAEATRSEAVIPLVTQDEMIGALVVEAAVSSYFDRDDLYLLEALGQRLCSSIKLVRYHEQLAFAAHHDGLTGVYNHRYFYDRLTEEVSRAEEEGRALSLILLDVNGLKAVNDTYGHLAGDAALQAYGAILRGWVGPADFVARYGGDEFALILPRTGRVEAAKLVASLTRELAGAFTHNEVCIAMPSASWGIAVFPDDGFRATELVLVADRAMYQEKRSRSERGGVRNQIAR